MSWLKAEAARNMQSILVTPEVSHALMSSLKDESANNSNMSVTPDVSQLPMVLVEGQTAGKHAYMLLTLWTARRRNVLIKDALALNMGPSHWRDLLERVLHHLMPSSRLRHR